MARPYDERVTTDERARTERYDPGAIERRWQRRWEESGLYRTPDRAAPPPPSAPTTPMCSPSTSAWPRTRCGGWSPKACWRDDGDARAGPPCHRHADARTHRAADSDAPPDLVTFGDGYHRVGVHIPPGRYRTTTPQDVCFWDRNSTAVTGRSGIRGVATVDIAPSDTGFVSLGCGQWTPSPSPPRPRAPRAGAGRGRRRGRGTARGC